MLSITHRQGNANQTHNEVSPGRMAVGRKPSGNKHWPGCGEKCSPHKKETVTIQSEVVMANTTVVTTLQYVSVRSIRCTPYTYPTL